MDVQRKLKCVKPSRNPGFLYMTLTSATSLSILKQISPQIMVVMSDKYNGSHLSIWEPYLKLLPYKVCICTKTTGDKKPVTSFPVFSEAEGFRIADIGQVPSIKILLYLANYTGNWRYFYQFPRRSNINNDVIHIFLGHGDSDKESSHSRVAMIYDYLMVADKQAVYRYHHNQVNISEKNFLIVGAPTSPGILVNSSRNSIKNILYAPTFEAKRADANFSSLQNIYSDICKLSSENTYTILFRPHPATGSRLPEYKNYSSIIKEAIGFKKIDKVKAFNSSDVIITDISGILTEYLFTNKPIIIPISIEDELSKSALEESAFNDIVYKWDYKNVSLSKFIDSIQEDPLYELRIAFRNQKFNNASSFDDSYNNFLCSIEKVIHK